MWLPARHITLSPPTANVQLPQLQEAASLDRLEQNHETLRLDVVARDVQVLQLHHGVEQDGVADEANTIVAHLDAYCSPATHNRTVQHQMLDRVHRVLAEVAEQRRHSLVADAVASKTQVLQLRRIGVVDGAREEQNTLVVDLVILQVQDLQRRHLPVRDQRGELHQTTRLEAVLYTSRSTDSITIEEEFADRRLVSRDQIVHVRGELDEEVVIQAQIYTSRREPSATGKHQRVGGEEQTAELHLLEDLLLLRRQTAS